MFAGCLLFGKFEDENVRLLGVEMAQEKKLSLFYLHTVISSGCALRKKSRFLTFIKLKSIEQIF